MLPIRRLNIEIKSIVHIIEACTIISLYFVLKYRKIETSVYVKILETCVE